MNVSCNEYIRLRPSAARLLESMRDIGYSFESALADIVDNSISAESTSIDIYNDIHEDGEAYLAIVDNGRGMTSDELTSAMQHGSRSPSDRRAETDLGRFGLGMKTASFSQCRRLTVVSRAGGELSARCWDLDVVIERDDWVLSVLDADQISSLPMVEALQPTGTLVIWQRMDRLDAFGGHAEDALAALNDMFSVARSHLALTFHRFISGASSVTGSKVMLRVNGSAVPPADPFAENCMPSADPHEIEIVRMPGGNITVQAFTLPHHKNLSSDQLKTLELGSSLVETQGLYIYRAGRLISGGTWLGLARRSELTKLLRVRIDVPTSLDSEWSIDVRKSRMRIPAAVRKRLRPLIDRMTETARRPYTYRGTRQVASQGLPLWQRVEDRGALRYEIRRDHPIIESLRKAADMKVEVDAVLLAIEATLPIESLFADVAATPKSVDQQQLDGEGVRHLIAAYVEAIAPGRDTLPRDLAEAILSTPVFAGIPGARAVLEEFRKIQN